MKKLLFVAILALSVIIAGQYIVISPCAKPIHYKIDTIDPKFNLSQDKFTQQVKTASEIWNKGYGQELFVYDSAGELSVNLIYDERQRLNLQIYNTEQKLGQEQTSLDQQIAAYYKAVKEFEAKVKALNQQIEDWNQRGGAPEDVYNQLRQEQADLRAQADKLDQTAKALKLSSTSFNNQVKQLNTNITTFNQSLEARPEEGAYFPGANRIEIYFNITPTETQHTIAHELGHALRLNHNDNTKSIMFSKTNNSIMPSKEDLENLKQVCKPYTLLERARKNLDYILHSLTTPAVGN